jgi:hypothetical protein|nr:MAG TPA: hypothetical protein [Caudoviricetes sp.]
MRGEASSFLISKLVDVSLALLTLQRQQGIFIAAAV